MLRWCRPFSSTRRILTTLVVLLFSTLTYAQWIVSVSTLDPTCDTSNTTQILAYSAFRNGTCVPSGSYTSRIALAFNNGTIFLSTFNSSSECNGPKLADMFVINTCITQQKWVLSSQLDPFPQVSGVGGLIFANATLCAQNSSDAIVGFKKASFAQPLPSGQSLSQCLPIAFTSRLSLFSLRTCNETHRIFATCSDQACMSCKIDFTEPLTSCRTTKSFLTGGHEETQTQEQCFSALRRTFTPFSGPAMLPGMPQVDAGSNNLLASFHSGPSCNNRTVSSFSIFSNDSCMIIVSTGTRLDIFNPAPVPYAYRFLCNETGLFVSDCSSVRDYACEQCGPLRSVSPDDACMTRNLAAEFSIKLTCVAPLTPSTQSNVLQNAMYEDVSSCSALNGTRWRDGAKILEASTKYNGCYPKGPFYVRSSSNSTHTSKFACTDDVCSMCFAEFDIQALSQMTQCQEVEDSFSINDFWGQLSSTRRKSAISGQSFSAWTPSLIPVPASLSIQFPSPTAAAPSSLQPPSGTLSPSMPSNQPLHPPVGTEVGPMPSTSTTPPLRQPPATRALASPPTNSDAATSSNPAIAIGISLSVSLLLITVLVFLGCWAIPPILKRRKLAKDSASAVRPEALPQTKTTPNGSINPNQKKAQREVLAAIRKSDPMRGRRPSTTSSQPVAITLFDRSEDIDSLRNSSSSSSTSLFESSSLSDDFENEEQEQESSSM